MNTRALAFIAAGLLLLGVLFVWLRPEPAPPAAAPSPPALANPAPPAPGVEPVASAAPQLPATRTFDLQVAKGTLISGPAVIQVEEGDPVVLRVTSDADDELHLHGYDLSLKLRAGTAGSLAFTADKTGRFEYELHRSHLDLGALEVRPR